MIVTIPSVLVLLCLLSLTFSTSVFAAGPASINLGTAGNFVILSKTGISTTGSTAITGDIGVSPAAATYMTGFALILPSASPFSTSALITGKAYSPDYANPTPQNLTTAIGDMQTAYTDGAGRTNTTATELGAGNIGGLTIAPGLYKWGTSVTIPTDVTLSGGANDVWIFVIAQNLNISSATKIVLSGGAQASNVFWVVAGQTTIGTTATFNGNILDQTAIVLNTGAALNGRALAQTAVTLDSNAVTKPSSSVVVTPAPAPAPTTVPTPTSTSTSTPVSTPVTTSSSGSASTSVQTSTQTQTSSVVSSVVSSANDTPSQAQLDVFLGTIQSLQAQIQARQGMTLPIIQSTPSVSSAQSIGMVTADLTQGDRNSDVVLLQQFLISKNKGSASVALATVGATGYFGPLTRAALAEFQASVGIKLPMGNFGPITRMYISNHY